MAMATAVKSDRRITAFGSTKTASEWALDPRAKVWADAILDRLESGMTPEQAIASPLSSVEDGPVKVAAFGELKTLRDWADDYRAETSYTNIRNRIGDGWSAEAAISTPTHRRTARPVEAWGETKSLRAWSLDERAGASYATILRRLEEGWEAERAISEAFDAPDGITAWGERKSFKAWAKDPRATVGWNGIRRRVNNGMAPEEAISSPGREMDREFEAFGETKRLSEWLEDPRCVVDRLGFHSRMSQGFTPERALAQPFREFDGVTAWGETKSLWAWEQDPRAGVCRSTMQKRLADGMDPETAISEALPPIRRGDLTAFGESKSLKEWAKDPRCEVGPETIGGRLRDGLSPEEAIRRPIQGSPTMVTAFGETKSLTAWEADPRSKAGRKTIQSRLENGMEAEDAITSPVLEANRDGLTAFGEWKTFADWALDPRSTVGGGAIAARIERGWTPEEAITGDNRFAAALAQAAETPRPEGLGRLPGFARLMTAFGETKSIKAWSDDHRCVVSATALFARLERGMSIEEALTTIPERGLPLKIKAFGETKSVTEWARDPRAATTADNIGGRLRSGWSPEEAITAPADHRFAGGKREAFGERKSLTEWSKDPRCTTVYSNLVARLSKGMSLEEALTSPLRRAA